MRRRDRRIVKVKRRDDRRTAEVALAVLAGGEAADREPTAQEFIEVDRVVRRVLAGKIVRDEAWASACKIARGAVVVLDRGYVGMWNTYGTVRAGLLRGVSLVQVQRDSAAARGKAAGK